MNQDVVFDEVFSSLNAGGDIGFVYTMLKTPGLFAEKMVLPVEYGEMPFSEVAPIFFKRMSGDDVKILPEKEPTKPGNVYTIFKERS